MEPFRAILEVVCYAFAFVWGFVWSWYLDNTDQGKFLAARRTWFTVVVGIGVDGILYLPVLYLVPACEEPILLWLRLVAILALSSVGIIRRSLRQEYEEEVEVLHGARRQGQ